MCTKGDPHEQNRKIDLSGLRPLFTHCAVVKEKNRETYLQLALERGFDIERTWMIGNSPKSDVNPALAAGLNAVFIPHHFTWVLEHEVVNPAPANQHLLQLTSFADLARHF